jgi:RNA-directed DNA polymerase
MGLELKPSKTRITHTLHEHEGQVGFDFLGFTMRQFPVGKYHTGVLSTGKPLGFKTIIKPSKAKVRQHQQRLGDIVRRMRGAPQVALIKRLNPIIRGWTGYYRAVVSKQTFSKVDKVLHHQLRRWALSRHTNKGCKWVIRKYWRMPHWTFGTQEGLELLRHTDTRIIRHTKVRGEKSPYDGDWAYWATRMGQYPGISTWLAMVLRRQQGRCARCGLCFTPGDVLEVHHENDDHSGNKTGNLVALHGHCHDNEHGSRPVEVVELDGDIHDRD